MDLFPSPDVATTDPRHKMAGRRGYCRNNTPIVGILGTVPSSVGAFLLIIGIILNLAWSGCVLASETTSPRFRLLWGAESEDFDSKEKELCKEYLANLNSLPPGTEVFLDRPFLPAFVNFSRPTWKRIDVDSFWENELHLSAKEINNALLLGRIDYNMSTDFTPVTSINEIVCTHPPCLELGRIFTSIENSLIDIDNDGVKESVYAVYSSGYLNQMSTDHFKTKHHNDLYPSQVYPLYYEFNCNSKNEMTGRCFAKIFPSEGGSVFLYKDKTYIDRWNGFSKKGMPNIEILRPRKCGASCRAIAILCMYEDMMFIASHQQRVNK